MYLAYGSATGFEHHLATGLGSGRMWLEETLAGPRAGHGNQTVRRPDLLRCPEGDPNQTSTPHPLGHGGSHFPVGTAAVDELKLVLSAGDDAYLGNRAPDTYTVTVVP
jgi:hypothetical protein